MAGDRDSEDEAMEDELSRRLRELEWPKPPPGLRERSLEEFQRRAEVELPPELDPAAVREH